MGGAWVYVDRGQTHHIRNSEHFALERILVADTNYRLVPTTDYKGQAADLAQAFRWLKDHAVEYGGDPNRIFLIGHSAGAHLVALLSSDDKYLKSVGLSLNDIAGYIASENPQGKDQSQRLVKAPQEKERQVETFIAQGDSQGSMFFGYSKANDPEFGRILEFIRAH
ncbi:MAG: alpha/beta hydrolase [Candidatus Caenarcaniphilales bacterium]|nr:alpha/beta hydrolase [Candidatus Caenarcaniphilales bacterium]